MRIIATVLVVLGAGLVDAQTAISSRDAALKAARTVIAQARYATMTTIDASGQPSSRVVDPFAPEDDFAVWIGTHAATRKLQHLASNPRLSLLYLDTPRQHYVSLTGTATVVRDSAEKARRFKPEWKPFYSNGSVGDDYVLIKMIPSRLEIVADSLGMRNDPATWRPVIVDFPSR